MKKITIKYIADQLGLSRNTVAMALRDDKKVAESTRNSVRQYASSIGYIAPGSEEVVSSADREHILVIRRPDWTAYWDRVIGGISQAASKRNYIVNITVVSQDDIDELRLPNGFDNHTSGVLFLHKFGEKYNKYLLGDNRIGIFLDRGGYLDQSPLLGDVIKTEGTRSIYSLTSRLIEQGLTRIAYLCPYTIGAETFDNRFDGYLRAMYEHGLPIIPKFIVQSSDIEDKDKALEAALRQFLPDQLDRNMPIQDALRAGREELPEAIVCANDSSCFKASKLLREAGIQIPDDIAMTGYDNDEYDAFMPFFTTVESNAFMLGKRMVEQYSWRRRHRTNPFETITLDCNPIFRKSSEKYIKN